MGEIFFPVSGVDFSELRQIALTFCHSFVNRLQPALPTHFTVLYRLVPPDPAGRQHPEN